jgi:FlaG/FlaF family flagellin (archaellin)
MMSRSVVAVMALLIMGGVLLAADKEVKGTVVKVDAKKMTLTVKTDQGNKTYTISDDTQFMGPRGGKSSAGIKDDRLSAGAAITLIIAGNNKTVREVHLPERSGKD